MPPAHHSVQLARRPALWFAAANRTEPVLATTLAALVILFDLLTEQPWQPMALDLCACVAAAATVRWPRTAGVALGSILAAYVFVPPPWATLGEYALLIPILGTGMRGQGKARLVMSVPYLLILAAISWVDAPPGRSTILGWILWTVLIGVLWLIGNAVHRMTEAERRARKADLVLQRQALARELHDTVARSFSRIAMVAERAQLHRNSDDPDLALIADTARSGNEELRWLLALLRDPADTVLRPDRWNRSLDDALTTARDTLAGLGFQVSVVVNGASDRLTAEQLAVVSEVVGEASANIVKHAEPDTPCGIILEVGETAVELVFVNRPRSSARSTPQITSMGLSSLKDNLARLGGGLSVDSKPEQWATRVWFPLAASVGPAAAGVPG